MSIIGLLLMALGPVSAQSTPATQGDNDPVDEGSASLEPKHLELVTKDQVTIHCQFYAGRQDKQTVPIIILHGWDGPLGVGEGSDVSVLARRLQKAGHAVAVPDLRGHGRSTVRHISSEESATIDRGRMRAADFQAMVMDVEAVRSFLVDENNAGRLNIELLCVIGFDMGAVAALNWIEYDWTVPSWPTLKQGQDVKAFVLVSPDQTFRGATTRQALSHPIVRGSLSAMIIYGQADPQRKASQRIYNTLRRSHRPIDEESEESKGLQDLFLVELDTSLRGSKLLDIQTLKVSDRIVEFVQRRLVDRSELYPWRDRSR